MIRVHVWMVLLALTASAHASPQVVLRMATVAPEGTPIVREVRAFGREIALATHGEVEVKWYPGAIAGSEVEVADRIRRGQLDGTASGGMLCERIAPTLRIGRVQGMYRDRDEQSFVLARLRERIAQEMRQSGYELITLGSLGPGVAFLRKPVHRFDDLKRLKLWRWELDQVGVTQDRAMGLSLVTASLEQAAHLYDDGQVDGFIAIPSGTLLFQWYTRVPYLLPLPLDFLTGCVVVSSRAFERLTLEQQQAVRAAGAKLSFRLPEVVRQLDDKLLGPLFEKHGVRLAVSDKLRSDFESAARAARSALPEELVPAALIQQASELLAGYRASHIKHRPR